MPARIAAFTRNSWKQKFFFRNIAGAAQAETFIRGGTAAPSMDAPQGHPGYDASQIKRKLVEEGFGWGMTIGGLRKLHRRGREKVGWIFTFTNEAYELVRMRALIRLGMRVSVREMPGVLLRTRPSRPHSRSPRLRKPQITTATTHQLRSSCSKFVDVPSFSAAC